MSTGTDLQELQNTPGFQLHKHGHIEHEHPNTSHFAYSHRHQYFLQDIGAAGTYSAGLWREMRDGKPDDHGPEHWHLEHR